MFLNSHEAKVPAKRKLPPSSSHSIVESPKRLPASQLWNVIEFSRQFPELTLYLVADLKAAELAGNKRLQANAPAEPLEFPPLIALDPRELRDQSQRRQEEERPLDLEEEIALFAAGELPQPALAPPAGQRKEKTPVWQYLLTFFVMALLLLWLHHNGRQAQFTPKADATVSADRLRLQASK